MVVSLLLCEGDGKMEWNLSDIITYIVINYLGMYINIFFYSQLLKTKYKDWMLALIYVMLNFIHMILSDYVFHSAVYKYVEFFVLTFCFVFLLYQGSFLKKIFAYIEINMIILFVELVSCQIVFAGMRVPIEQMQSLNPFRNYVMIICNIATSILCVSIIHIQKRTRFTLSIKKAAQILICFLLQILAGSIYNLVMVYNKLDSNQVFAFYITFSIVLDMYLLKVMAKMEIKEETERKIEYFQKQEMINTEYYANLAKHVNQLEQLRNDYEDELQKVYEIVGKEYQRSTRKDTIVSENQNIIVENIIAGVQRQLEQMQIDYKLEISIPKDIPIQALDLSSILTNLFDNAIEALGKCKAFQKESQEYDLIVKAQIVEGYLSIMVKNRKSKQEKVKKIGDSYITTKSEKQVHGYGMKIIERIVKKYNGTMEVRYTDIWFQNQLRIPLDCETGERILI